MLKSKAALLCKLLLDMSTNVHMWAQCAYVMSVGFHCGW